MAVEHDRRHQLLARLAQAVIQAAHAGQITTGRVLPITKAETVAGPRAGAVEFQAGLQTGPLHRALSRDKAALARQFVPWDFQGQCQVYLAGRAVRVEAAWPPHLAETDIPLESLAPFPKNGGRWIAGKNETGATITLGFNDEVPGFLFSGTPGSGKSCAIRTAAYQLAQDPLNRLVLIDGTLRVGEGLGPLAGLPGLAGPLATNERLDQVLAALTWAVGQMNDNYRRLVELRRRGASPAEIEAALGRLIVVIDEVQEFTAGRARSEATLVELIRRLVTQGRAARTHVLLATHQPTADVFGDSTIKAALVGRVALKMTYPEASRAALGRTEPRADWLLGQGDAYCLTARAVQRAQLAYVPETALRQQHSAGGPNGGARPMQETWPLADPSWAAETLAGSDRLASGGAGSRLASSGDSATPPAGGATGRGGPSLEATLASLGPLLTYGLIAAHLGHGRVNFQTALAGAEVPTPGNTQAVRVLNFCREVLAHLDDLGWRLCAPDPDL